MPTNGPLDLYTAKVGERALDPDPQQQQAMLSLDRLFHDLMVPTPRNAFGFKKRTEAPHGVYLYGGVGRGKSMLMDLFFLSLPQDFPKRRVHFHAFMLGVHDALNRARLNNAADRALDDVAKAEAAQARVLCFDEFHVTDVADAMILSRLFTALFAQGVTMVATSNWPPERLYEGGLQRDRFLPFIDLVKARMEIVPLTGGSDYRLKAMRDTGVYFAPLGETARARADELFARLSGLELPHRETIEVKGRTIVTEAAAAGAARFTFAQLCERPTGAEDFLAIAARYHTVFLEGVPKLNYDRRNEAKRLMTLIDVLYDNRIRLVVTADAPADQLYLGHDHAFEFQRTVSRMIEMQGEGYLLKKTA